MRGAAVLPRLAGPHCVKSYASSSPVLVVRSISIRLMAVIIKPACPRYLTEVAARFAQVASAFARYSSADRSFPHRYGSSSVRIAGAIPVPITEASPYIVGYMMKLHARGRAHRPSDEVRG